MTFCNNNDQTWFSDTLTSARPIGGGGGGGSFKLSPLMLEFQHPPRGTADVNA